MMSDEELDLVHDAREAIWEAVHDLVNKMTAELPSEVDDLVRMQLTETFRFWRSRNDP
jgi:hypothetical protein